MNHSISQFYYLFGLLHLLITPSLIAEPQIMESGLKNTIIQKIAVKASQGVAVDQKYFYAISNTKIVKYEKETGKAISRWEANKKDEAYKHFMHMNSGTVIEGKLFCAHSRYGIDPDDCSVEIWNVEGKLLEHEETIQLPRKYGSLTWIDRHNDGSWWMCYAVYGKNKNKNTTLVKYEYKNKKFMEIDSWVFPKEVVTTWGKMSCSGGSWGSDGYLYTTGHDNAEASVLKLDKSSELTYVRTETDVGFYGQAIAWDRFSTKPILWGIIRNKEISLTLIPKKK